MVIKVENGKTYTVDTVNKTVTGGRFQGLFHYTKAVLMVGAEGSFTLADGRVISIGKIVEYVRGLGCEKEKKN